MRRKLGKNLCSLFLTLTMILGLFPGMSMTAHAEPTEELLTTITATGKEQASYSTENVATVSFSYTANGSSSYYNKGTTNWGWWGYGWIATVNAADGYTITKCVFYDDKDRTATDSEAPFVVETTEEDKTPQVNGAPILAYQSKGITKIEVYGYATPAHTHSFTYSASGATITATCSADGCDLDDGTEQHNHTVTLTIAAEGGTYDGTTAYSATVTNNIPAVTGDTVGDVAYYKVDTQGATTGGTVQTGAPTGAGYYYASVTLTSGSNTYTAVKAFTVAKADPTAPTGLTATYGQKLSDVALTTSWTWADSTQSVGSVGSNTFKANFAGNDNYNSKSNVDLTVTVSKAANPATVTNTATVTMGGNTVDLASNVTSNGATGTVNYEFSGETNGCTLSGSVLTSGTTAGSVTVNVTVGEDSNYNALDATPITVTINDKLAQTITAADVTATYGDTDKKVTATVTDPATGGGAISYAVKTGSEDYIDVNATTGALTIKKVPADGMAYVIVTAAETNTYAQATKEVTVTINKANAVAATVTANNRTYDSTKQPLVTVTDTATGGTMQYAIGTNATAVPTTGWSASIPEETNAGTYYVWYKVAGDDDHNDSTPACVTVTISKASITPTVSITGWTYGENANDPTVSGNPGSGTVTYTYAVAGSTEFSGTVPTATGNYTVKVSIAETDNYLAGTATADFEITKAASDATAPTANDLTYTGVAQTLVTAGTATGGTMQYAIGTNATAAPTTGWSTTVPARTNAGPYYVWYKVAGDDDHNDSTPACVTVTISKASFTPTVSITGWTYGEDANTPSLSPNPGNAVVTYTYTDSQGNEVADITAADAGAYNVKATVAESDNYLAATSGITTFAISKAEIDKTAVTVSVESWVAGEESNNPIVTGLPEGVSAEDVVFEYAPEESDEFTSEVPSTAGNYVVKAIIPELTNYKAAEVTAALTIDPVVYNFVDSEGLSWVKGSSDTISFTAKRNVSDNKTFGMFKGILVDGTEVAESNYTAVNGSVIVTLKSAYLNTLSVGDHTLTIRFSDGSDITTTFTVKASGVPSPATGETISIWTLMGFACIAVAGAVISFKRWKKEKV